MGLYDRDYYREHHKARRQPFTLKAVSRFPLVRIFVHTVVYCLAVYGALRLVADVAKMLR